MKLNLAAWLLGALAIGIILWISSSDDYSLDELQSKMLNNEFSPSNEEMADRDNAAEEVRAVATKISNLEQIIENQNLKNIEEQNRLRDTIDKKHEEFRNAIENSQQPGVDRQLINMVDSLMHRIEQLEEPEEMQEENSDTKLDPTSAFVWYYSDDIQHQIAYDSDYNNLPSAFAAQSKVPDISHQTQPASSAKNHYTIPPTTTLLNATALTALVGRIPVRGKIQDPWRFKIIIGPDNLAANGHRIPQLAGMIWVGTARGDLALSCVSGNLDTATFIFTDGSIQTSRNQSDSVNSKGGLGWISDEYGNPCIAGELKSNALQYLAQSTLVDTTQATADAIANAQTESRSNANTGETNKVVVGNVDKFVAGYAIKESLTEVSQWLKDRQLSSFDAIYVPAGQNIAIHVEEPIYIDYDSTGRKVIEFGHDQAISNARNGLLD